jgi:hypothetical protein
MGPFRATAVLQLPVCLHGIQLGRPVDLLLDIEDWHVVGFVVRCGDESMRFLPFAACQTGPDEIAVASALMLLEDVAFYAKRGASFRSLLGGDVVGSGVLRDVLLDVTGSIGELEVERDGERVRVAATVSAVVPTRASAA